MKLASDLKVGDVVWFFDPNRRVYRKDENGNGTGSPIWREHWCRRVIIAEKPRSWLVGHGSEWEQTVLSSGKVPSSAIRLPNKGAAPAGWAFSPE